MPAMRAAAPRRGRPDPLQRLPQLAAEPAHARRSRGRPAAPAAPRAGTRRCPRPAAADSRGSAPRSPAARRRRPRIAPSSGQIAASRSTPTSGQRQQLDGRCGGTPSWLTRRPCAAAAVGVSVSSSSRARAAASAAALAAKARARSGPTQPSGHAARRQPQVGIVGAQRQAVLGARGEHPVGLDHALRGQVVDQHAEIGLGAVGHEVGPRGRRPRRAALMPASRPWAAASS